MGWNEERCSRFYGQMFDMPTNEGQTSKTYIKYTDTQMEMATDHNGLCDKIATNSKWIDAL